MKVDGVIDADPASAVGQAKAAEGEGYDGTWVAETDHDPFLSCGLAAEHTSRVDIGTSIAVAFARSPMTLAATANDLQQYSSGRFILGLGSQIKPHIERRFSMPWSAPATRMREMVAAMRAIWSCWHDGVPLTFEGDFYTHTLMTPFFSPGAGGFGAPRVFLAGVGERMTEVAGEDCDGFICHPFSTERYIREITLPALQRGSDRAGRDLDGFEISFPTFIVTAGTEEAMEAAKAGTRAQIAFYGSTPAYRAVLELHGWGDLQTELHALSTEGRWVEMGEALPDEVLETFAVVGEPDQIAPELERRYADCISRLTFYTPYEPDPAAMAVVRAALQAG